MKSKLFILLVLGTLFVPLLVFGQATNGGPGTPSLWPTGYWGPLVACNTTRNADNVITNPCAFCDILDSIQRVIYLLMSVVVFILTPVMAGWGGFNMLIAGGSPERFKSGLGTIKIAITGLAIVLAAFIIVNTIIYVFGGGAQLGLQWPTISCSDFPAPFNQTTPTSIQ